MSATALLRKLKGSMFPKLVLDRTPLDNQIAELKKALGDITAKYEAALTAVHAPAAAPTTFHFNGYDIPVDLMQMTGGGPETFEEISAMHQSNLAKWIGIKPQHHVLEIGCGIGRDAIPLSTILSDGSYVGVDIIGRSIEWCTANIGARNPNFKFVHYDVDDQLHNPGGTTSTEAIVLPIEDRSIDRIFLFSVFTHMYQEDIEHYLHEFSRVLKPDGLVYATTFIYDDAVLESARSTNKTIFNLRFEHELHEGCRINNLEYPLGAVAFTRELWQKMLIAGGMKLAKPILNGQWSGLYDKFDDGQDVLILQPAQIMHSLTGLPHTS
ncbi:MAG: methyltransferase domain-containing protein [Mesorhizobium sp.]|uniref:class I SAM-dependent methyltransferase n=1 Tax=unclassified Mesorhizobium TaxID=325217 RepID=UPI000F754EED|nr:MULTISPECIES: class I SAM-dependent methyltransferase [unclassified Mesorhizobium]AZO70243.1 class I SAM-dependent methyltransferase [Mesorhizobium sp. M1D.F.Ca.ET.043.01.1.1]RWA92634.1 MAG: methyltransferase domain-containing protein [Mesorhizobium sp.]RWE08507.1 MAG: methyltransferase domain-containing protein [Mesorhizobium sp.]TIW00871.1 MAG: methyltransferase domain-containing protein [Mesorhizobium sp.]TJW89958.1 MAG: methyltransferase domain-containing protein [Mesorhizobium sp.]